MLKFNIFDIEDKFSIKICENVKDFPSEDCEKNVLAMKEKLFEKRVRLCETGSTERTLVSGRLLL